MKRGMSMLPGTLLFNSEKYNSISARSDGSLHVREWNREVALLITALNIDCNRQLIITPQHSGWAWVIDDDVVSNPAAISLRMIDGCALDPSTAMPSNVELDGSFIRVQSDAG